MTHVELSLALVKDKDGTTNDGNDCRPLEKGPEERKEAKDESRKEARSTGSIAAARRPRASALVVAPCRRGRLGVACATTASVPTKEVGNAAAQLLLLGSTRGTGTKVSLSLGSQLGLAARLVDDVAAGHRDNVVIVRHVAGHGTEANVRVHGHGDVVGAQLEARLPRVPLLGVQGQLEKDVLDVREAELGGHLCSSNVDTATCQLLVGAILGCVEGLDAIEVGKHDAGERVGLR